MVIPSFIISIIILAIGVWASMKLESTMNNVTENQLLIEPSKFSYKMWKDMPVTMYQSFTFFNLTNWNQVKSIGQKPKFVEVGPYVYKTIWTKSDINFLDDEKMINFAEKKQWIFQPLLSRGYEDDLIWTINTPLMTALALIQNAPVITRNIVSVILDGLGEGAFIKRNIKSLLFDGYSDLIVSVGPLFDRRFANFNGKFAYLYNKNDSIDGHWTVSTGTDDLSSLNKIIRFQSNIVNMTTHSSGQMPQGLNEVKPECAKAWSLDQATNGQLFAPFNKDVEQFKLQQQLEQLRSIQQRSVSNNSQQTTSNVGQQQQQQQLQATTITPTQPPISKRFFSRSLTSHDSNSHHHHHTNHHHHNSNNNQDLVANPFLSSTQINNNNNNLALSGQLNQLKDIGKFIFYPDLCRPIHLLPSKQQVYTSNGIQASRYLIDPRVFMNSTQVPANKCFEMNPRPPLANTLAATINSVTGANVAMPNLVVGASSPFAMFTSGAGPSSTAGSLAGNNHHGYSLHNHGLHHLHHHGLSGLGLGAGGGSAAAGHHNQNNNHYHGEGAGGLFERANHNPASAFINNALQTLGATVATAAQNQNHNHNQDQLASAASTNGPTPISRLGRVRQLFSNIVSQRMSVASPGSLLPTLTSGPAGMLNSHHHHHNQFSSTPLLSSALNARNSADELAAGANNKQQAAGSELPGRQQQLAEQASQTSQTLSQAPQLASLTPAQQQASSNPVASSTAANVGGGQQHQQQPPGGSDRWITQFRFKWPRGVFSIGQCQLGAPIYASLPHFLDADEYYLEQVDGLKPNRSLHEFYIDIESTLHSIPVGAKARLQLNVATPELRFRNIPNAMIPVLWQEVTFNIDKPIATMLYWSFTMSGTIYKLITISILTIGGVIFLLSIVKTVKKYSNNNNSSSNHNDRQTTEKNRVSYSSASSSITNSNETLESTSSQLHSLEQRGVGGQVARIANVGQQKQNLNQPNSPIRTSSIVGQCKLNDTNNNNNNNNNNSCCDRSSIRLYGPALNHGFTGSCADFLRHLPSRIQVANIDMSNVAEPLEAPRSAITSASCLTSFASNNNNNNISNMRQQQMEELTNGPIKSTSSSSSSPSSQSGRSCAHSVGATSPKLPSSRASSHCELIQSNLNKQLACNNSGSCLAKATIGNGCNATAAFSCSGCFLACLRHSTQNSNNINQVPTTTTTSTTSLSDNSLVRPNHHDTLCSNNNHFQQHNLKHYQQHLQLNAETSDIDKATLSSRNSFNMDSCSPIYNNDDRNNNNNNVDDHNRTSSFKQ